MKIFQIIVAMSLMVSLTLMGCGKNNEDDILSVSEISAESEEPKLEIEELEMTEENLDGLVTGLTDRYVLLGSENMDYLFDIEYDETVICGIAVESGSSDGSIEGENSGTNAGNDELETVIVDTSVTGEYTIKYVVEVDIESYINYVQTDDETDIVYEVVENAEYIEVLRTVTVVDTEMADTLCESGDIVWISGNEIYEKPEEDTENTDEEENEDTSTALDTPASEEPSEPQSTATEDSKTTDTSGSVVDTYPFAESTTQVIDVVSSGSTGTLTLYNKDDGVWTAIFSTSCYVGYNGISSNKVEGDKKTPAGYFTLGQAFGVSSNPGCTRSYLQVNSNHYWVDDSSSPYYNQLVDSSTTGIQWSSADHLIDSPTAYKYAIAINYNTSCTPGAGSAIFLHCQIGKPTVGCVSVGESYMVQILQSLRSDTIIYIH